MIKYNPARVLCVAIAACCFADASCAQSTSVLVDDFDGTRNRLGGYRNTFQKAPSSAVAVRAPAVRFGHSGMGLQLTANRLDAGYCGYWLHFFNIRAAHHEYVDASAFHSLCFWVKGAVGGEQFTIKLADDAWIAKEDAAFIGEIGKFLAKGVTTRWQQVRIPLDEKLGLNLQRLGGLTLDFETRGRSIVFIDNVSFEAAGLSEQPNVVAAATPAAGAATKPNRALYLWTTEAMLDDLAEANKLFQFCNEQGIQTLWAQLPYDINIHSHGDVVLQADCVIRRDAAMRRFLASAHTAGLKVHALEGYPEYSQRQQHHVPLAIVDAVLAFNVGQPPAEQFDGIHFDNEPYLLVGWQDPQTRKQILYEYLTLNSECQRRIAAASPRIEFGVDIPFWWQAVDRSGEPQGIVSFQGKRQPASLHLLEMLDNVCVMDYRDTAAGSDGIITHARELLTHADQSATTKLYVGLETTAFATAQVLVATGRSRSEFEQSVRSNAALAALSRLDGYRLQVIDDGEHVHVGIQVSDTDTPAKRIRIAKAISQIASVLGVDDSEPAAKQIQNSLVAHLQASRQWSNVKPCTVRDPDTGRIYSLVKGDSIEPAKFTFADESARHFARQTSLAEAQLRTHASYAGLAIHDYESFRRLMHVRSDHDDPANDPANELPVNHNGASLTRTVAN